MDDTPQYEFSAKEEQQMREARRKLSSDMNNDAWLGRSFGGTGRGPMAINQETQTLAHDALVPRRSAD
jgi:hypothetical protein